MKIIDLEIAMWEAAKKRDAQSFLELVDANAVMVCGGFRCSGSDYALIINEFDAEQYQISNYEIIEETNCLCQIHYIIETTVTNPQNSAFGREMHI